jgi:SAM-dependent methyltransferase
MNPHIDSIKNTSCWLYTKERKKKKVVFPFDSFFLFNLVLLLLYNTNILLLLQSLARLGAQVTGIDASPENIQMATLHASTDPLLPSQPMYRAITAESLLEEKIQQNKIGGPGKGGDDGDGLFDVVCALEILEHVNDPAGFLESCTKLLKVLKKKKKKSDQQQHSFPSFLPSFLLPSIPFTFYTYKYRLNPFL